MNKPYSIACDRNRTAILEVLSKHFAESKHVLEVGSGTGQHAVFFAAAFPQLIWQSSDRLENHAGIRMWLDEAALPNTPAPLAFDVNDAWPEGCRFDGVFSANTLHIMSWPEVERFFAQLPQLLAEQATLVIYGPFNYQGRFTSDSNAAFDASLKSVVAHRGIRDFEAVNALAEQAGLSLIADQAMPANNRCLVWRKA
jgi:cyclopropane fatty-acyl-phospholipid synthase-like methyltransferase